MFENHLHLPTLPILVQSALDTISRRYLEYLSMLTGRLNPHVLIEPQTPRLGGIVRVGEALTAGLSALIETVRVEDVWALEERLSGLVRFD